MVAMADIWSRGCYGNSFMFCSRCARFWSYFDWYRCWINDKCYINESNDGSFGAGWWGGQVSGLVSAIPGIGVPLGAFVGSVTTDWIDKGWIEIDWNKALVTCVIAYGVSLCPTMIGEIASKFKIYDKALYFVNAYDTILAIIANSIVNVYWRGNNNEK